jgi:hypothetical protein
MTEQHELAACPKALADAIFTAEKHGMDLLLGLDRVAEYAAALRTQPQAGEVEQAEAANWRSLMACQRIRVMGFTHDGNHMGVEFWREHPEAHPSAEYPQDACRDRFEQFVQSLQPDIQSGGGRDE